MEQSKQQRESAQALLISNQVSKGFEQLGNDKVEVRLGGIYLLEGVMNTSKDYHEPVLEALCAFVRDHTKANTSEDAPGLSQSFSDRYASLVRGRDDLTSGYGLGFQTAEFLPIAVSKQVRQSAISLQIVRGKTLRQAP